MKTRKNIRRAAFVGVILALIIGFFVPLPYYVSMPGTAEELDQFVAVENGEKEAGEFMFTTVGIVDANLFDIIVASVLPYYKLERKTSILMPGENEEDYMKRQELYMKTAQQHAVYVAYEHAGEYVDETFNGIFVTQVREGMPAAGVLKAGDIITAIDGRKLNSIDQLFDVLDTKKQGDTVSVQFTRQKETLTASLSTTKLESGKIGIGIAFEESVSVTMKRPITVSLENVGGPSAGLMFSLEIYNQLTNVDYTKGYKIAGTGTINRDGDVGPIGGIDQKIVAADREGADIFLAPNEQGEAKSNYEEALKTAKKINTNMKVIPVDTFDDAIQYLKSLK